MRTLRIVYTAADPIQLGEQRQMWATSAVVRGGWAGPGQARNTARDPGSHGRVTPVRKVVPG